MVIWVAVGGRGTLVGAALGAVRRQLRQDLLHPGMLAPYWLFALGALFVLVTLFLPKGIVGTFNAWRESSQSNAPRRPARAPQPRTASPNRQLAE